MNPPINLTGLKLPPIAYPVAETIPAVKQPIVAPPTIESVFLSTIIKKYTIVISITMTIMFNVTSSWEINGSAFGIPKAVCFSSYIAIIVEGIVSLIKNVATVVARIWVMTYVPAMCIFRVLCIIRARIIAGL